MPRTSAANRRPARYSLFLNPYVDMAFTRCPRCEAATRVRKIALAIHVEPGPLFLPNKVCRFCVNCELVIVPQEPVEQMMVFAFGLRPPLKHMRDYLVFGTLDRADWLRQRRSCAPVQEVIRSVYRFVDRVNVAVDPGGWRPSNKGRRSSRGSSLPVDGKKA